MDEKYIILTPMIHQSKDIFVIDVTKGFGVIKSKIKIPGEYKGAFGIHKFILIIGERRDELVNGFLRRMCATLKVRMLSYDVLDIIGDYCVGEMLYYITQDNKKTEHWKIPVSAVVDK